MTYEECVMLKWAAVAVYLFELCKIQFDLHAGEDVNVYDGSWMKW